MPNLFRVFGNYFIVNMDNDPTSRLCNETFKHTHLLYTVPGFVLVSDVKGIHSSKANKCKYN